MKKNVLLIMPEFYNYQAVISKKIEELGYNCYVVNEEPGRMEFLFLKNIKRLLGNKDVYGHFRNKLINKIVSFNCRFDYVIVIRGNLLNEEFLKQLKESCTGSAAKWIYYTWDSLKYLEHKGKLGFFFDRCYSFDSMDVKENKGYELLPLFWDESYSFLDESCASNYDYCCIAGFSKERYAYAKIIINNNPNCKLFIKLYISKKLYLIKMLKDRRYFSQLDKELLLFKPFTAEEIKRICKNSKAIVDITHAGQHGLTMRTIESLGMRRKIVTNNECIKNYNFYQERDFYVVDDKWILPGNEWLDEKYGVSLEIRDKYSIQSWIRKLMCI